MLKIRLQRVGRRNDPTFRVVLTDSKNGPRSGKFLEVLGSYNPRQENPPEFKSDRIRHWLSKGAQVSPTLHNFFVDSKITEGKKINVLPRKTPIKKEADKETAATSAAPAATPAPQAMPEQPTPEVPSEKENT